MCAVLLDVAKTLCGDVDENGGAELRNKNAALLEVCLAAHLAGWVELGSASAVGVSSPNLSRLSGDCAFACHSFGMVA